MRRGGASEPVVLAVDHGTSGIKAALITLGGEVRDFAFAATPIHFLPKGGAEQDPDDWWNALVAASRELTGRHPGAEVRAVAVSSTWSSTVAVDRDGQALMNALTWMDSRGAPYVRKVMRGTVNVAGYGVGNLLRWVPRTAGGPTLSGKDDVAHALLIKHEFPEIYARTAHLLSSKDYLNLRLCGEVAGSPDSMMLFWVTDIRDLSNVRYDDGLIKRVGLDRGKLPPLRPSASVLGTLVPAVARELGLAPQTKVIVGSPDHQSALVGSGAVRDGQGHLYVGTSSWVQCPVEFKKTDVLHSIASLPSAMPGRYQAVNEQDVAGGALAALAELAPPLAGLDAPVEDRYGVLDRLAADSEPGSGGLIATPWLNGERTPVDDPHLRGALVGLSTTTTAGDVARAVMEGVACNTRWALGHVETFAGTRFDPLRFVGGGARSDVWCQIFADLLDRPIHRVADPMQANARGAALIAAVALGELTFADIPDRVPVERRFSPDPAQRARHDDVYGAFIDLHKATKGWFRKRFS
ncbi:MAG: FGGY-family carbohydrate kinase [Myxococcota bacterium]|nr:FGGY-family carbohydrate kinase [Myxococcota bacterium]